MAQISNANLQSILDKIARHAAEANGDVLATAIATGGAYAVSSPNSGLSVANSDVLAALDTLVHTTIADVTLDRLAYPAINTLNIQNPTLQSFEASLWAAVVAALDAYGLANNALALNDSGGIDAMLRVLNAAAPTLRVHAAFDKYVRGIAANNTFTDVPYVLGTIAVTGAAAGTLTLAGLNNTGQLDTSRFGPGQIAMLNSKGSAEGTQDVITLMCNKNGVATQLVFTAGATTDKYLTAATGDTSKTFTGLSGTGGAQGAAGCALVSIATGTAADAFSIVILPDRPINAA